MNLGKLKNIFLLAWCCLKFIIQGRASKRIENPQKILVIQLSKLGDMVCTTPVFRAIKERFPKSKLYVMGNNLNQGLLKDNPDVDEYLVFSGNILETVKIINKEKIDFGLTAVPGIISLMILCLSNIPSIVTPEVRGGFSPNDTKSYRLLSRFVIKIPHQVRSYAPRQYLRLLEPLGIYTDDTKKYLFYSDEEGKKVKDFYQANGAELNSDFLIGISPSAGNKIKLWGADRFAKLANYLYRKYYCKIVIIGSQKDKEEIEKMRQGLDQEVEFINTIGFSLEELKALIVKLSLLISVDSGPIYIAEAFAVPTIDIVGPVDENDQPPRGKYHRIVKAEREKSELYVMNARVYNYREAKRQIKEITVEMVIKELDDLMSLLNAKLK